MDHHCPWVGSCVGFQNHKLFYLMLLYTIFSSVYALSTQAVFYWSIRSDPLVKDGSFEIDEHKMRQMLLTNIFCICLIIFLSIMVAQQTILLLMAYSSIEIKQLNQGVNPFFLGPRISEENLVNQCVTQLARF